MNMKLSNLLFEITKKLPIKRYKAANDIERDFDKISSLRRYKNNNASYDDIIYAIPMDVFSKTVGWTESEIVRISGNLDSYEGALEVSNKNGKKFVLLFGSA